MGPKQAESTVEAREVEPEVDGPEARAQEVWGLNHCQLMPIKGGLVAWAAKNGHVKVAKAKLVARKKRPKK